MALGRSCPPTAAPATLSHGLGAIEGLADDIGVAGVLGGLGDHVQQHPACRPVGAGLKPGRRGQRLGGLIKHVALTE